MSNQWWQECLSAVWTGVACDVFSDSSNTAPTYTYCTWMYTHTVHSVQVGQCMKVCEM